MAAANFTLPTFLRNICLTMLTQCAREELHCHAEVNAEPLVRDVDKNSLDCRGRTALIWASEICRADFVAQLLAENADVNAKSDFGCTALVWAAVGGHPEVVVQPLEKGAEMNAKDDLGQTALIFAMKEGHAEVITRLLEKGADVDANDYYGTNAYKCLPLLPHSFFALRFSLPFECFPPKISKN